MSNGYRRWLREKTNFQSIDTETLPLRFDNWYPQVGSVGPYLISSLLIGARIAGIFGKKWGMLAPFFCW
jgi:hypothetical protein